MHDVIEKGPVLTRHVTTARAIGGSKYATGHTTWSVLSRLAVSNKDMKDVF